MTILRLSTAAAAALSIAILASCTSTHGTATNQSSATVQVPATSASPIPTFTTPTPTPSPTATTGKIGSGSFTYSDGLKVLVPSAVSFTPSQTSAGGRPGQTGVLVTVTITNGTTGPVDLALAEVKVTAGAAGNQADPIFDSAQGIGSGFSGSVLPGHSQTTKFGFSVAPSDLNDVIVHVTPGLHYDPASFEGSVG